ncbi:hypothetical protein DFH06DRAFT_1220644 [Mycena polygramma]|nr:hypothetical protein DFH06DRAFT_1220644 [Mycena polygramma]
MPVDSPAPLSRRVADLLREFIITVALSSMVLLVILYTVQYHVWLFVREAQPCTSCTPCTRVSLHLAALSPLDVVKITTVCAALVFIGMEVAARILLCMGWIPRSTRMADAEAEVGAIERGEIRSDEKAEPILRPDVMAP